jgi:hypothetical protein
MAEAGRLAPLRVRSFRLLFFGQSSSVLGDAVAGIALTFAVLELGVLVAGIGEFASIMFMLSRSSVRRLERTEPAIR